MKSIEKITLESLLVQWYEEAQNQRIEKGFIKVNSISEIYSDLTSGYDICTRNISLKQYKLFSAIFAKQTKNYPSQKELCFVNINDRTLVAHVSGSYERGFISYKLK